MFKKGITKGRKIINKIIYNSHVKKGFIWSMLVIWLFITVTQSIKIMSLNYRVKELTSEITQHENNYKLAREKIEQMTTDQYIEKKAREELQMVRNDETPIIINEEKEEVEHKKELNSRDKIGIYLKDWYKVLEQRIKGKGEEMKE